MRAPKAVQRDEFVRLQVDAIATAAQGGPPFYFGAQPLPAGRMLLALRTSGVTYCTTVEQRRDVECDGARARTVDRYMAREMRAAWTDYVLNTILKNRVASRKERRAIKMRWDCTPVSFAWATMPDGRHLIWAYNANYARLWPHGDWYELAAHPSEYGDIWRIAEDTPQDGFGGGRLYFGCLPSLERWAEFETIDGRLWEERLTRTVEGDEEKPKTG